MIAAIPHLMFQGAMADAVALWSRAFPDLKAEPRGKDTLHVTVAGQPLMLFDSPPVHDFTFTPAISLLITCDHAAEVDRIAGILAEGGHVFMPLDAYPFSPRYTWIADRFGVSWQIMLPPEETR